MSIPSLRPTRRPAALPHLVGMMVVSVPLLAACAGGLNLKPAHGVDLSGQWQLDASLSDDPRALIKSLRPRGRRGGGRETPAGELPDDGAGRPGGDRSGVFPSEYLAQPSTLAIEQQGRELDVVADGSPARYVYGETVLDLLGRDLGERRAGWDGDAFVVRYELKDGPDARRSFQLDASGRQLTVTTTVSGGGMPKLEFRSIYARPAGPTTTSLIWMTGRWSV